MSERRLRQVARSIAAISSAALAGEAVAVDRGVDLRAVRAEAAILWSHTSSCRRHGVDPQRYLTQLLVNLPTVPEAELDAWLADEWKRREAERERADGLG